MHDMSSYVAVSGTPQNDTCYVFGLTPQEVRYLKVRDHNMTLGYLVTWLQCYVYTWLYYNMITWLQCNLDTWLQCNVDTRASMQHGYVVFMQCGYMASMQR